MVGAEPPSVTAGHRYETGCEWYGQGADKLYLPIFIQISKDFVIYTPDSVRSSGNFFFFYKDTNFSKMTK